jgi:hypothetical protein
LAAILAGANDLRAIFRWGRRLTPEALQAFGIETGKAPCHATYHYFFAALDADALSLSLGRHAPGGDETGHLAIDGKTLRGSGRGSKRGEDKALHLLSAFAVDLSAVIGDLTVAPDANEITTAITLLKRLPLNGAVITGDAIFAQREICRHIQDAGGHYLFTVKSLPPTRSGANQPALRRNIEIAFGDDSPLSRLPLRPA